MQGPGQDGQKEHGLPSDSRLAGGVESVSHWGPGVRVAAISLEEGQPATASARQGLQIIPSEAEAKT